MATNPWFICSACILILSVVIPSDGLFGVWFCRYMDTDSVSGDTTGGARVAGDGEGDDEGGT